MKKTIPTVLACGLALAACSPQNQAAITAATPAATSLAAVAAANSSTVARLVIGGQLFCQGSAGVVALLDLFGKPTSVIGASAAVVRAACAAISAVPVPPPTNVPLEGVPAVVAPTPIVIRPASP